MGVVIFFLVIGIAFLGYVLPWGQISFWGASVITNLISSIPYLGNRLVIWVWGRHSIDNPALTRFFCLHFIIPFILLITIIFHLFFLHFTGSNNPLRLRINYYKIYFSPIYTIKDLLWIYIFFTIFLLLVILYPYFFIDRDNFLIANPIITPEHIQPEWYFLFAYAILRSIPRKLGGVIALLISISILIFLPIFYYYSKFSNNFFPILGTINFLLFTNARVLTWIGIKPVESPYYEIGIFVSFRYFALYITTPFIENFLKKII